MIGIRFTKYIPQNNKAQGFDELLKMFLQLLIITSGDVAETLNWLNQLDQQYGLTNDEYGMGDFIQDLKDKGYIEENEDGTGFIITAKSEQSIRRQSLEEIFGKLKKSPRDRKSTRLNSSHVRI